MRAVVLPDGFDELRAAPRNREDVSRQLNPNRFLPLYNPSRAAFAPFPIVSFWEGQAHCKPKANRKPANRGRAADSRGLASSRCARLPHGLPTVRMELANARRATDSRLLSLAREVISS